MYIKKFNEFITEAYVGQKSIEYSNSKKRDRKFMIAQEMEKRGEDAEKIRLATGWFKNPFDDKWRFEVSDARLKFKKIDFNSNLYEVLNYRNNFQSAIKVKLKDLVEFTSLFKEYPAFKNLDIVLNMYSEKETGHYSHELKEILINGVTLNYRKITHLIEGIEATENRIAELQNTPDEQLHRGHTKVDRVTGLPFNREETLQRYEYSLSEDRYELKKLLSEGVAKLDNRDKSVLLHELQHTIQYAEGFALGSSPSRHKDIDKVKIELKKRFQEFLEKYPELKAAHEKTVGVKFPLDVDDPLFNEYIELEKKYGWDIERDRIIDEIGEEKITAYDQYLNSAGEIESRDVQNRMGLDSKGGFGIFDMREKDGISLAGLIKRFDTKEEAEEFLNTNKFIENEIGEKFPVKFLEVDEIKSKKSIQPFKNTTFDKNLVNKRFD